MEYQNCRLCLMDSRFLSRVQNMIYFTFEYILYVKQLCVGKMRKKLEFQPGILHQSLWMCFAKAILNLIHGKLVSFSQEQSNQCPLFSALKTQSQRQSHIYHLRPVLYC